MCVANGGTNGNATYFADSDNLTTGSADSMVVNGSKSTGTCVSPTYWKVNLDTGAAPVRRCLYQNSTQNIDQVYLGLVDSTQDCVVKTCSVTRNQTFGNPAYTRYSGANKTDIALNSTINLTYVSGKCKDNSNQATITCKLDGSGNPTLQDLTNPYTRDCRTCNTNAPKNTSSASPLQGGCGCSIQHMIDRIKACQNSCSPPNHLAWPIAAGSSYGFSGRYGCDKNWSLGFRCDDGTLTIRYLYCS
jgi:hypothetical protein